MASPATAVEETATLIGLWDVADLVVNVVDRKIYCARYTQNDLSSDEGKANPIVSLTGAFIEIGMRGLCPAAAI